MTTPQLSALSVPQAFDLSGRVAVVTGAGRGIGRAIASRLAEAGASVGCADVVPDTAEETVDLITAAGGTAWSQPVDVTDRVAVDALVADAVARHGHLDVMVNNAAIITDSLVLDTSEEDLDRVMAVNFKGVFFGCQAAGRVMKEQGSGSIINLASGAIDIPTPGLITYSAAKVAVAQLTRTLAVELAPFMVRVNAIAPGWIDTPMNERHARRPDGSVDPEKKAEYVAQRSKVSPMGIPGEPDDIAFAALYLAAPAAKFVTGVVMRPNGGSTMPI
ncbi:MAG: glucose 1-dehydrogenase [Actinobacteria bacterium]|nr:glucose 1-dehydrogenase [Actinomycetota bacterium]